MSFDKMFDLTAGVHFFFFNIRIQLLAGDREGGEDKVLGVHIEDADIYTL